MTTDSRPPRPESPTADVSLPWDEQAERAVLGAVLLDPVALDAALEVLHPEDFHRTAHRLVFQAFIDLVRRGQSIDLVTVRAQLEQSGALENVGGAAYLSSLIDGLPRTTNVAAYARIVQDRSLLRQVLGIAERLRDAAAAAGQPAVELLDHAERDLFSLSDRGRRGGFRSMRELAEEGLALIEEMSQRRELITGLTTGYDKLDRMLSGLQRADLVILAARPSMGKTALALNIAQNAALNAGVPVGVFSLEMSSRQLFFRMLAGESRIDLQKLRTGSLALGDWDRVTAALERLAACSIHVDDTPGIGPMEVRAKARRLKYEQDIKLLVIDYLQLMQLDTRGRLRIDGRQQEVAEVSRSLKAIAKELDIPVLALSQLSRQPESGRGSDHRPQLSDLRESGAIEQDADVVMFIYREEVYEKDKEKVKALGLEGKAELIVAKQRNGPTGTVPLFFVRQYTRFENQEEA